MEKWKKSKVITVSTILAVLLSAIVVFLCFVPTIEANVAKKKHFEERVAYFKQENTVAANSKLVFLGDGLVENYDLEKHYSLIKKVFNRGVSGDDTFSLQERLNVSLLDIRPAVCVLLIGTNNIKTALKNYEEIVATIKDKCGTTKLVIQSIYPTSGDYAKRNEKIVEVNKEIEAIAKKYNCTYVDVHSSLKNGEGELDAKYTTDGLHLNKDGYKKVTEVLTPILSPLVK